MKEIQFSRHLKSVKKKKKKAEATLEVLVLYERTVWEERSKVQRSPVLTIIINKGTASPHLLLPNM